MGKRPADISDDAPDALKSGERPFQAQDGDHEGDFEDEFESEDEIFEAGVDGRPDEERDAEEREGAMDVDQDTFIVGRHKLSPGETLAPDLSAYEMIHTLEAPWPCLSSDIVRDNLGDDRKSYPATVYAVAGTQAARGREKENELMVMKLSSLSRMDREGEEESDEEEDDDDENADPILETKSIPLNSCANRIRVHQAPQATAAKSPTTLTATMLESGQVMIHDITPHLSYFDTPGTTVSPQQNKPVYTMGVHKKTEGYAVDWSPLHPSGRLLTGDNDGKIFATTRKDDGTFVADSTPFTGHASSVEELQWSPSE
ncbi:Ribosome assembly protein rrb1, partial [Cryomyces antarcticus]